MSIIPIVISSIFDGNNTATFPPINPPIAPNTPNSIPGFMIFLSAFLLWMYAPEIAVGIIHARLVPSAILNPISDLLQHNLMRSIVVEPLKIHHLFQVALLIIQLLFQVFQEKYSKILKK